MNAQEIFDRVLAHLRVQGPAYYRGGCQYRTSDGKSCAVGCLIPDELYDAGMENHTIRAYGGRDEGDRLFTGIIDAAGLQDHLTLLGLLQYAHDSELTEDVAEWEARMKKIAGDFNLTYTPT